MTLTLEERQVSLARRNAREKARLQSPEYRAKKKLRQQTAKYKAYDKKRKTPEWKARAKAYRQTPEYKAWDKIRRQDPKRKAQALARNQTPEVKAGYRAYRQTPVAKELMKACALRRREAPFAWARVSPWPTDCMICGLPFEGSWPDARSETIGHEPPVAWMLRHPEYDGTLILRPEHASCNIRKSDKPDWEK
jgi:uncharacterized membrane protein YkoI